MSELPEPEPIRMNIRAIRTEKPYTQVDNRLLNDPAISFQAKGLLSYLLSKTDDWKGIAEQLAKVGPDGIDCVRATIKELIFAGYAKRIRVVDTLTKRVIAWELVIFEDKAAGNDLANGDTADEATLRRLSVATYGKSTSGPHMGFPHMENSTSGKSRTTKYYTELKTESTKEAVEDSSLRELSGSAGAEPEDEDQHGLNAGDLAEIEAEAKGYRDTGRAEITSPAQGQAQLQTLALTSDDEPNGKDFPWRQIMAAVKRIVPAVTMPTRGHRRDAQMKLFWKRHGKTVGCFELLAQKVADSDYLMARNGHTGHEGRPYSWGWIFEKNPQGELRADKIMDGGYTTESMSWLLEKKAKAAAPKLTKVMRPGVREPMEVDLSEMWRGRQRFQVCDEHMNGLKIVVDLKD